MAKPALRLEARRLRIEERLSLNKLQERIGVAKSTLSLWCHDIPLTSEELKGLRQPRTLIPREPESALHKLRPARGMSRSQKGNIGEAAIILRLAMHGYTVVRSLFEGSKGDVMVEDRSRHKLIRLQVKWARQESVGRPVIKITSLTKSRTRQQKRKRYSAADIDFIVGYDYFADIAYVFSMVELADHKQSVSTTPQAAERWDKLLAPTAGLEPAKSSGS